MKLPGRANRQGYGHHCFRAVGLSGYRDKGTKLLVWEFSLLSAAPKGLKFRALLSPTKTTGALRLVPFGAEGAQRNTDKPTTKSASLFPFVWLLLGNGHNLH